MKKLILTAIATVLLGAMLASCGGGSYECGVCGETFEGKGNKVKKNGTTITVCDECNELFELAGGLFD